MGYKNKLSTNNVGILSLNERSKSVHKDYFSSVNGFLSFYRQKSMSRIPILENIKAKGALNEDGNFIIYFNSQELINISSEIKEELKNKYGFEFVLYSNTLFFKGNIMDGFKYNHLSEEISTFIVNGNIVPFNRAKRTSSIGILKKIENVIHLNSSLNITYKEDGGTKFKKHLKSNVIGVDISMQFKNDVA